jgi:plastocyanin
MRMGCVLAAAGIAVACDLGNPGPSVPIAPPPPPGHSTTISVQNNAFYPVSDTIALGTITFSWAMGATLHNVTWTSAPGTLPANSGDHAAPNSFQATLQQGRYTYHCTIHGATMNGVIVVQ